MNCFLQKNDMNTKSPFLLSISFFTILFFSFSTVFSQNTDENPFWSKVKFGGGLGASVGNSYTNILIAPSAVYQVNQYVGLGVGLQGSYVNFKNNYNSFIYGGSLIGLVNPIEGLQLSAELEQVRVNLTYDERFNNVKDNFWNTGLFLGAGYQIDNITIGVRYNVLYKESDYVYNEAWMPFIRVYF
jgi:long-subunit fatty acid transport protein